MRRPNEDRACPSCGGTDQDAAEHTQDCDTLVERAICTLCAGVESPGFYTGCMQRDEGKPINGWVCDGSGHLTRAASPSTSDTPK